MAGAGFDIHTRKMSLDSGLVALGDTLTVAYDVCLRSGEVMESASSSEPETIVLGSGRWPVQVELSLVGLSIGEQCRVELRAEDQAFGVIDPARVVSLLQSDFKDQPSLGELIDFSLPDGESIAGLVVGCDEKEVEVDFNHPYAGRDVCFEVEILERVV